MSPSISETTAYCQEMYAFPGMRTVPSSEEFPNGVFASVDGLNPIRGVEPAAYYTRRAAVYSLDQELEVPSNLEALLDRFYSSSADDQDRFLRACFWFNHAQTVFDDSSSAVFMALISAIESLMPHDEPSGTCVTCKRSIGKGSTRRLREFLDEFAPAKPAFQHSRAALYYQLRSQLSHGGPLTMSDRHHVHFSWLHPKGNDERWLSEEVKQLVRIVMVNWLSSARPSLEKITPSSRPYSR